MTRVLQLRRGTATQHQNFVGLMGEITMDTDNKTLRLHDGQTPGGFIIGNGNGSANIFDINSVPESFWAGVVARHTPQAFRIIETTPTKINSRGGGLNYVINEDITPKFIQTVLICQSDEAGYATGDEVWCWGIGNRATPQPTPIHDENGTHIRLMCGAEQYWVNNKNTGVITNVTDENWCVLFRVYC